MTTPETPQTAPRVSLGHGVKIALGLSLALNLLIAGVVAGTMLSRMGDVRDGGGRYEALRSVGLAPMVFAMEPEDRAGLHDRMAARRDRLRPEVDGLARSFQRFTEAVAVDPFDRDTVAAALETQRGHVMGLQSEGHRLLLDQLEAMTPAARADFAQRLQRRLARRGGGVRP